MTRFPTAAAPTRNLGLQLTLIDQSVTLHSAANRRSGQGSNQ
jgi:hypothetical protein